MTLPVLPVLPLTAADFEAGGRVWAGAVGHVRLALGAPVYLPLAARSVDDPERRRPGSGLAPGGRGG